MRYFAVICTAFVLAFLAGLPDKSMFASLILSTRYRPSWVWAGAAAAFAVHMAMAVTAGRLLALLPHRVTGAVASTPAAAAPWWANTATGVGAATGAWAAVRYAAQPWGTELEVQVPGIPAGTRCQLRVTDAQGQDIAAGGWTITAGSQHAWYPGSVPWPAASLRGFAITAGGQTLVTVPAGKHVPGLWRYPAGSPPGWTTNERGPARERMAPQLREPG